MHSTTLIGGAALVLASTSLAKDITKTTTVTQTTFLPLSTPSSIPGASTVSIYDLWELHGTVTPDVSIITANPTATVYKVACPLQTVSFASIACGSLTSEVTITQGASTVQSASAFLVGNATETISASCNVAGTTAATCVVDRHYNNTTLALTTATLTGTGALTYIPALITGTPKSNAPPYPWGTGFGTAPHASGTGVPINGTAPHGSGTGAARPTGLTTSTGRTPPQPSATPSQSPPPQGAAAANAPVMVGVGALAGLVMAVFAL